MKRLLLATFVMSSLFFTNKTDAQLRINVNLNIGRPSWGLTNNPYGDLNRPGDYYYLPEIDCYYSIPSRQFIYFDRGQWMYGNELPYMYRGYDLNRGYKVIVNEPYPYMHADVYRQRYSRYYNVYRDQAMRGNRYDDRFGRNRYDDRFFRNRRDDRFDRDREDQHFDNRRFENDRRGDDDRDDRGWGNGNGRWKSERRF